MINYFLILNNCSGSQYGIGTYVKQLFDGLKRRDYSLSIIEMSATVKEFLCSKNHLGITTYQLPVLNTDMNTYCKVAYYLLIQKIPQLDNMVFHFNFAHHEPLMHLLREHYSGCRILFTVHYLGWCFELNGNYPKFKKILNKPDIIDSYSSNVISSFNKEKIAFNSSDEVIVLSDKTRKIVVKDYKIPQGKVHLVRNGLSGKVARSHNVGDKVKNEKRILFVGRLDEQKGLKLVLQAFKIVAEKLPTTKLYVVGNGDFESFLPLCEGYRDQIMFTGRINPHDLNKIYATASIGLLPSFHEQCSYTAIEMMKYGIPLIISDRMENLADYSDCVVSIPYLNKIDTNAVAKQLSEKILAILSDDAYRKELSYKMRNLYEMYYSQHRMITVLNDIIVRSFERDNYIVPSDYFNLLDKKMFSIILKKPEIDFQFYGMGGICAYLWYRIEALRKKKDICSKEQFYDLQKFLLFYVDWLDNALSQSEEHEEICNQLPFVFSKMLEKQFYKTKTRIVLSKMSCKSLGYTQVTEKEILENAVRIYNCEL